MSKYIIPTLVVIELLLIIASWMVSASHPELGLRNVISPQGARYFLGHYAEIVATPLLSYIIFIAMTAGCIRGSGIMKARPGQALYISLGALTIFIVLYALISLPQHAIMRSATGQLLSTTSPFVSSIIPVGSAFLTLTAALYGMLEGHFQTLTELCQSLFKGIATATPLLLYYIMLTQIYYTITFVWE